MKNSGRTKLLWLALLLAPGAFAQQQFAALGDFKLESGVLQECRIGYRTFGSLNSDQSNVILFPTWAGGTTEELSGNVGPGKLVDSSKYYVILVDALSNGLSSSPSNSKKQPRMRFPKITIRDMVNTQHELLTRVFHLQHVKAVLGISMGGMQTFQWMTAYPGFMDKAVPMVGSPRLAPYDLLLWQAQIDAIQTDPAWHGGDYEQNPARAAEYEFGELFLTTPEHYNRANRREQVLEQIAQARNASGGSDANDKIRQCEAMMSLDVSLPVEGSMARAAAAVKAKVLVVVSKYDHVVTPGPATEFARLMHAQLLELTSDCGHLATSCEAPKLQSALAEFLEH